MPTRITQIEDSGCGVKALKVETENGAESGWSNLDSEPTLLKVEGTLYLKDTELLERICRDISAQTHRPIVLDLADIGFLDSDSASVLCRMKREQGVRLEGLQLFIAKVVELTEAEEAASKYLPRPDEKEGRV